MLILPSKLKKPITGKDLVPRQSLIQRMSEEVYQLIHIACQTGYGKSTLVGQWLDQEMTDHYFWYSLETYDNDFSVFMTYLTEGIRSVFPEIGGKLTSLWSQSSGLDLDSFYRMYMSILYELPSKVTIVLDDAHHLKDPQILHVLSLFISFLQEKIQWVLISREKPLLNLSVQRLQGLLLELGEEDLCLSKGELADLSYKKLGQEMDRLTIEEILNYTEGWVAGAALALMTMKGKGTKHFLNRVNQKNHEQMVRGLFEHLLEDLSSDEKDFLMVSSVPDSFSPTMCKDVFDLFIHNSQSSLSSILNRNLFVIEIDPDHLRYHHLFRQVLIAFHKGQLGGDYDIRVKGVYKGIADWFMTRSMYQEAYKYYLECSDQLSAAAALEFLWAPMDLLLNSGQWLSMAESVPKTIIERRPVLSLGYCWALIDNNRLDQAYYWLDHTEALYRNSSLSQFRNKGLVYDEEQYGLIEFNLVKAKAYIAGATGDINSLFHYSDKAVALMDHKTLKKYGEIMVLVTFAHWGMKSYDKADKSLDKAVGYEAKYGEVINVDNYKMVQLSLWLHRGKYHLLDLKGESLIDEIEGGERVSLLLPTLYLLLAQSAYCQGRIERCHELLKKAAKLGNKYAIMDFKYRYYAFKTQLALDQGDLTTAALFLEEAKAAHFPNPIPDFNPLESLDALVHGNLVYKDQQDLSNQPLIEPLTLREIQVLTLIEEGLSNKEICQNLFLALSTVKGYIQNIFAKLSVRRRTEAVARAKELNIL